MSYHFSPVRLAVINQTTTQTNGSEHVEKKKLLLLGTLLQQCASSAKKVKIELPSDPAAPERTKGSEVSRRWKGRHTRDDCGTVYNRKIRSQPRSLSTWMGRGNTVHDHTTGHFSIKSNSCYPRAVNGNGGHVKQARMFSLTCENVKTDTKIELWSWGAGRVAEGRWDLTCACHTHVWKEPHWTR